MDLGRGAYEAYANHTGWKSLATGQSLPRWDNLPDVIKAAWQVSAAWVAGRVEDKYGRQIPVRDAAAAKVMKEAAMSGDWECDHMTADDLLCKLLADLGCDKTVKAYEKVGKWYA